MDFMTTLNLVSSIIFTLVMCGIIIHQMLLKRDLKVIAYPLLGVGVLVLVGLFVIPDPYRHWFKWIHAILIVGVLEIYVRFKNRKYRVKRKH